MLRSLRILHTNGHEGIKRCGFLENVYEHILLKKKILALNLALPSKKGISSVAANKAGTPLLKQNHLSYTTSNKQSSKQLATHACFCHLLSVQNSYAMCMP